VPLITSRSYRKSQNNSPPQTIRHLGARPKLTASQNALIDKAITREKEVIKTVKEHAPLVETYIQNLKPDPVLGQIPDSGQHFLGRVEFGKIIGGNTYEVNKATSEGTSDGKFGFFRHSASSSPVWAAVSI
jgi:hypothetical protein